MNLEVNKKYRIYRSVAATFIDWDEVPATLVVGKIVTVRSIEADKNVVVEDEENQYWYIRYTSLASLDNEEKEKKQEKVEQEKKKEVFNWDAFKELVKEKQKPHIVNKREVNIPKDLENLVELVNKYENKDDAEGLNSYFYNGNVVLGGICYASAFRKPLDNFGADFKRLEKYASANEKRKKAAIAYVDWVVNRSPFAGFFSVHTYEMLMAGPAPMYFDKGEENGALSAAIVIRMAWEFDGLLDKWYSLVENGVEETIAFLSASLLYSGTYNKGNHHACFRTVTDDGLIRWITNNIKRCAASVYEVCGSSASYGKDQCLIEKILIDLGFMKKDEWGYVRMTRDVLNEKDIYLVAESLAEKAMKELNNA